MTTRHSPVLVRFSCAASLGALVVVVEATATPAVPWLRIAILGAGVLVSLAGNGWLRGVQGTIKPLHYVVALRKSSALLCPLLV